MSYLCMNYLCMNCGIAFEVLEDCTEHQMACKPRVSPSPAAELVKSVDRIASLEAENAELKTKLADHISADEAQVSALNAKIQSLAPHGTCACSYDKPDDICGHHSPQVSTLRARLAEAERIIEKFQLHETNWSFYPDCDCEKCVQIRPTMNAARAFLANAPAEKPKGSFQERVGTWMPSGEFVDVSE